jgi:hypothetical protein
MLDPGFRDEMDCAWRSVARARLDAREMREQSRATMDRIEATICLIQKCDLQRCWLEYVWHGAGKD